MHKPLSLMHKIAYLRLKGLKPKQICERLNVNPTTEKVYWWKYKNQKKHKLYLREYYLKNKAKIDKYNSEWAKRNPDLKKEYQYRNKCNKAGVDWRNAA